jgi:hypothetical protein
MSEHPRAGYNTPIPESITTPEHVDTRIGAFEFFDGLPTRETADRLYDHLVFLRGVEAFLNGVPAASLEAMRRGMAEMGGVRSHQCVMFDRLLDSSALFLTGNTDTVYASVVLDLERDGATVVEIPPGCGPGTVNDAWFRFVIDMGGPGPDRGQGGKYLILPPDYDGDVPDGYFAASSPSYTNWLILRGFLVEGRPDAAAAMFREGLRVYPLSAAEDPPAMEFISGTGRHFNTIHSNDYSFYEELHAVIDREPIELIDPETRGLLASIGIRKGQRFEPDQHLADLLSEAAKVGNATARALSFQPRLPGAYIYDDGRHWQTGFIGGDYRWLSDGGAGGRNLDARTYFFYLATVNTPAMAMKMVGVGSQYGFLAVDRNGEYLDGGKTYRLNIPADPPAKDFWSVVAYDPQTRSELQTGQPYPSKNSEKDPLVANDDGSVDLYFGPSAPEGVDANWIQTVPGKGWFILLRLYGPLEPWFDQTWRPGELVLVD